MAKKKEILVLGIGNILLSDEGVGVHVVSALEQEVPGENVELVDGGTAGADLLEIISDRKKVIVIDAVDGDYTPGTIVKCGQKDLLRCCANSPSLSLHDLNLSDTLMMTKLLNCHPREVIIFGIKPYSIEPSMEMTEDMKTKVPDIVKLVLSEIG